MAIPAILIFAGLIVAIQYCKGWTTIEPNKAVVCTFFGKYIGTVKANGIYFINPCYRTQQLSLKNINFETTNSKVNDANGTPIEIAIVIVWRLRDTAKALFEVEGY